MQFARRRIEGNDAILIRTSDQQPVGIVQVDHLGWMRLRFPCCDQLEGFQIDDPNFCTSPETHKQSLVRGIFQDRIRVTLVRQLQRFRGNDAWLLIRSERVFASLELIGEQTAGVERGIIFGNTNSRNHKFVGLCCQDVSDRFTEIALVVWERVNTLILSAGSDNPLSVAGEGKPIERLRHRHACDFVEGLRIESNDFMLTISTMKHDQVIPVGMDQEVHRKIPQRRLFALCVDRPTVGQ